MPYKDPIKKLLNDRKYVAAHREEKRIKTMRWRENNPIRARVQNLIFRTKQNFTVELFQRVYEKNIRKYNTLTCHLCLFPIVFGEDSIDHIKPISLGGTNHINNLNVAHRSCNTSKRNKTLKEYREFKEKCNGNTNPKSR